VDDPTRYDAANYTVTLLNTIIKGKADANFALRKGNTIVLKGSAEAVRAAKLLLATELDIARPQVRLAVWTVQLNELKHRAREPRARIALIKAGVAETRKLAQDVIHDLTALSLNTKLDARVKDDLCDTIPAFSGKAEFWTRGYAPIRMAFTNRRLIDKLMSDHLGSRSRFGRRLSDLLANPDPKMRSLGEEIQRAYAQGAMKDYCAKVDANTMEADLQALTAFAGRWNEVSGHSRGTAASIDDAERLRASGYDVDRIFRRLCEGWDDDVAAITFQPLIRWAERIADDGEGRGLDASGLTTIAVTSGQPSVLSATMEQTRSYTAPITLTAADIKNLFGVPGATAPIAGTALDLILKSATPTYGTLAPGVSVGALPTVLPDGSAARVAVRAISAVTGTDAADKQKIDAINKLDVETDVPVSTYDLFELSTVHGQFTALGDISWRVPILEGLPLIGSAFHGPRRRDTKVHEATVLVSVGILPRAFDMMRSYRPVVIAAPAMPKETDKGKAGGGL
jgi:hypothetical protein